MDDQSIQSMIEEDRTRFRVGGGRLHFRQAEENVGYSSFHADGESAVLHCYDGQEAPQEVTCVVLSRYGADEAPVYIGQCVCCGTVWIAGEGEMPHEARRWTHPVRASPSTPPC